MSKDIFVTTYEMLGSAAEAAEKHFASIREARAEWWALAKKYGARGFRPGHYGAPPMALIFEGKDPPAGFRYWGRPDANTVECKPHKATKVGRAAAADLAALKRTRSDADLAADFGWTEWPTNGRTLFYATCSEVALPTKRYFLRLPRFADDGWTASEGLKEIPESELMRAIEDHNAAVRAVKEAA